MTNPDDPKLTEYARKLRWALSSLPETDRDGIVQEMRSHVLDRVDAGAAMDQALAALGAPEDYARAFRESYAVATALSSRKLSQLVAALLHNAARSVAVAASGVVIFLAWSAAAIAVYLTVLKISDPAHVGLWRGEGFFFIGIIDDPSSGRELLGPWLPAIALFFILVAWGLTHILAVWALSRLAPRN
jgi:uncharacterized membrane protein